MTKYYLGPWQWRDIGGEMCYAPPVGADGAIDLGTLPEMATPKTPRKGCLCWTSGAVLPSEYALLGEGDVREITRSGRLVSALQSGIGYAPHGDRLHEMIMDCLIGGADPEGLSAPKPIMPGTDGWMDLWLEGHGRVKGERFEWGRTPHTSKVKAMLRQEFAQLMLDAQGGKLNDAVHHQRILDAWCEKYRVDEWKEFVPDKLQKDVPGRVPHATTITESFDQSDSSTLGPNLTWNEVNGDLATVSNQLRVATASAARKTARAESDLSSVDHYSQLQAATLNVATGSLTHIIGALARFSSSAETCYDGSRFHTVALGYQVQLSKIVAGTATTLAGPTTLAFSAPETIKTEANGSAIAFYTGGVSRLSVTDTAITTGTRCGVKMRAETAASDVIADNFQAADLAAAGILYTQLERSVRGLNRGTYTQVES